MPRSPDPAGVPEPWPPVPPPKRRRLRVGWFAGVAVFCAVLAAGAFMSVAFLLFIQLQAPPAAPRRVVADALPPAAAPTPAPRPRPVAAPVQPTPAPQLVIADLLPAKAGEAEPLGLTLTHPRDGAEVVIGGLAIGAAISAGRPAGTNRWRLAATELAKAAVTPPADFSGSMDLSLELRLADGSLADRKELRLSWLPRPPDKPGFVERHLSADEIANLLERGRQAIANGDLAAARALFLRAAEARDAHAAFALAETYDANVLQQRGEQGLAPDSAMARSWYERAKEFGSQDAALRLQSMESAKQ